VDVLASALKHGVSADDIQHALSFALTVEEVDEDPIRYLVLGPDFQGNFLELVVADRPNGPCEIHAMTMREQYRALLPKTGDER
jgi:hypothetical protein